MFAYKLFDCAILFKIGIFDLPFSQLQALKNNRFSYFIYKQFSLRT